MSESVAQMIVTEYAVQYRTYIGGKFERTVPYESEAKAKAQAEKFNKGKPANEQCRVAVRQTTKWRAV